MQHLSFLFAFSFVRMDSGKRLVFLIRREALLVFLEKVCPLVKPLRCIYAANGVLMGFHAHFPDRWAVLFTKMSN